MRRRTIRILFAALVASSVILVIACVQSVRIAEAQTRPGHGGGGGGVALQSTSPGTPQTGNIAIKGTLVITNGNGNESIVALSNELDFQSDATAVNQPMFRFFHPSSSGGGTAFAIQNEGVGATQVQIDSCSSAKPCIVTTGGGGGSPIYIGSSGLASISNATGVIVAPNVSITSAQVTNNGTTATIARQIGTAITSATRTGTGQVTIALSGMTTLGIVNCTAFVSGGAPPSTATSCSATPVTNQVLVAVFNGANALSDTGFMLTVQAL